MSGDKNKCEFCLDGRVPDQPDHGMGWSTCVHCGVKTPEPDGERLRKAGQALVDFVHAKFCQCTERISSLLRL